jgi:hypothetical protein
VKTTSIASTRLSNREASHRPSRGNRLDRSLHRYHRPGHDHQPSTTSRAVAVESPPVLNSQRAVLVSSPRQRATDTATVALPPTARQSNRSLPSTTTETTKACAPNRSVNGRPAGTFGAADAPTASPPQTSASGSTRSSTPTPRTVRANHRRHPWALLPNPRRTGGGTSTGVRATVRKRNGHGLADRRSRRRTLRRPVERRCSPTR